MFLHSNQSFPSYLLASPQPTPSTTPNRYWFPWGVQKVWHIKLGQDQAIFPCVKPQHGISLQGMGSNKPAHAPGIGDFT